MLIQNIFQFLQEFSAKVKKLQIDISTYNLDHVAYQASSAFDFDAQKQAFLKCADFAHEAIIGGRRVAVFKLREPLHFEKNVITALEVIEPKEEQVCDSHWEHAEYVIPETFDELMKKYSHIPWDISSVNRSLYSHLKVKLDEQTQVKFHRMDILQTIQLDK